MSGSISLNCEPVSPGNASNASLACEAVSPGNIERTSLKVSTMLLPKVVTPAPVKPIPSDTVTNPNSSFGTTTISVSVVVVSNGLKSPITIGGG